MLYSTFGSGVSPSNNATGGAVEVKKKKKKKKKKVHKRVKTFPVPGTDFWFIQQCRGVCFVCLFVCLLLLLLVFDIGVNIGVVDVGVVFVATTVVS